jgi:hypothetical protein
MSTLGDAADVKFGKFGKFQYTERFLIPCPRHVSSRLSPSGETCKYATAPIKKLTWRDSLPIDMLLSAVSVMVVAQPSSEVPEGFVNYSVLTPWSRVLLEKLTGSQLVKKFPAFFAT